MGSAHLVFLVWVGVIWLLFLMVQTVGHFRRAKPTYHWALAFCAFGQGFGHGILGTVPILSEKRVT